MTRRPTIFHVRSLPDLLLVTPVLLILAGCLHTMAPLQPSDLPVASPLAWRMNAHVQFLAHPDLAGREPGTPGNRKAADYIHASFRDAGLHSFPSLHGFRQLISPGLGDNVLGFRPATGGGLPRWILIGAHFDHLGGRYAGADDNASGIAILLELAGRLRPLSNYSVVFAAFNTEERPYFGTSEMGSEFFVEHLPDEIATLNAFQAVIVMDLMGGVQWEPTRDAVFTAGAEKSPGLYKKVKEAVGHRSSIGNPSDGVVPGPASRLTVLPVGIHLVEEIPGRGHSPVSDYDAFRNRGVPFMLLSSARTPRYHTHDDQAATLHYERMAATAAWMEALLHAMDADLQPYTFEKDRVEFADEVATFRDIVGHAIDERTLLPGTSRWSLFKLKQDARWLDTLAGDAPTEADRERLERVSVRFQCLLADYSGCFLF